MEEIWKDIDGYEGHYQVSNIGNVKGLERIIEGKNGCDRLYPSIFFKHEITKDGYKRVVLMKYGKKKRFMIHRLVISAFITNIDNKPYVNHINGDKSDNRVENLEWCTNSENMLHADLFGLRDMSKHQPSNSKRVKCIELDLEFPSIGKAVKYLGKTKNSCSNMSRAINECRKYCGLTWIYS